MEDVALHGSDFDKFQKLVEDESCKDKHGVPWEISSTLELRANTVVPWESWKDVSPFYETPDALACTRSCSSSTSEILGDAEHKREHSLAIFAVSTESFLILYSAVQC